MGTALGVAVPPEKGCYSWKKRGAPDSNVCTALVTAMGWRCTGQGVAVSLT